MTLESLTPSMLRFVASMARATVSASPGGAVMPQSMVFSRTLASSWPNSDTGLSSALSPPALAIRSAPREPMAASCRASPARWPWLHNPASALLKTPGPRFRQRSAEKPAAAPSPQCRDAIAVPWPGRQILCLNIHRSLDNFLHIRLTGDQPAVQARDDDDQIALGDLMICAARADRQRQGHAAQQPEGA